MTVSTLLQHATLGKSDHSGTYATRAQANVDALGVPTLTIPTFDATPSVTHMDVLHIPAGWNGHRYWSAITPYPSATRELPEILCSDNGVDWSVPAGGANPVVTQADVTAAGMLYASDPDLEILADGVTMALYYRPYRDDGTAAERVYRKTSTDGITWSAQTLCVSHTGAAVSVISPAVVLEADGTYSMFSINASGSTPYTIEKRTSADGLTWSAPAVGTTPAGSGFLWHIDVIRVTGQYGTTYYALVDTNNPAYRLYLWTSTDGLTWKGSPTQSIVPLQPGVVNDGGHYRSTLVPVPGDPLRFDIYACNRRSGPDATTPWSVSLFKNVRPTLPVSLSDYNTPVSEAAGSGKYLITKGSPITTATMGAGNCRWSKFEVPRCTVDEIGWELAGGVASSVARVGIYGDNGLGFPDGSNLILDTGTWDTSVASGPIWKAISPSLLLLPGRYWIGLFVDTAASPIGYRCLGVTNIPGVQATSRPSTASITGGFSGYILSGVASGALPTNLVSIGQSAGGPIFWLHTIANSVVV